MIKTNKTKGRTGTEGGFLTKLVGIKDTNGIILERHTDMHVSPNPAPNNQKLIHKCHVFSTADDFIQVLVADPRCSKARPRIELGVWWRRRFARAATTVYV